MGVTDFAINTVYFTLRVYQFTPQSISHIERIKSHQWQVRAAGQRSRARAQTHTQVRWVRWVCWVRWVR